MPPTLPAAQPPDTAAKAWAAEVAARNTLQDAQAVNAAALKIERLARREPIVADLLEEYNALKATVTNLRQQNQDLEAKLKARKV